MLARSHTASIRSMPSRTVSRLDLNFIGTAIVLAAVGCLAVYSATWFTGYPFWQRQVLWAFVGIALMIAFIAIDYHVLMDVSMILYGVFMVLLLYLLVWGKVTANVKSWIHIGAFQFQPSEFMKIFTALVLAKYFETNDSAYLNLRSFSMVSLIIGAPLALIIFQPDFGTAASFFPLIAAAMYFGGIRLRYWLIALLIVAILVPSTWLFFLQPYQKERIMIFLDPERDPLGSGYQVTQAKIAIGSGGLFGKGFKEGTQAKLDYLPAKHTDFIFAVLGEEWGFVGVTVVLALYLFLILQAFSIAKQSRDRAGTFLVIALISFFIFHIIINVAMQIGLLPTTGIPLPLISYGGSSTMMFMMAIGVIANVDFRKYVNA
ncbi:MAG TPA: rod shape-determining protein RodA [Thermoanaerobaculia bacterium]|nr:rod shape-determining protein RodA [Thermoanaerobaculia bacterium]